MPHVLSELEGVKKAVFKEAADGHEVQAFDRFETLAPGRLSRSRVR